MAQACGLIFLLIARNAHYESYPRVKKAYVDIMGSLKTTLGMFEVDCGRFPTTKEGWKILISPRVDGSLTNWRGPYLDPATAPIDPWGHEYVYRCPGVFNTNGYDVYSLGPDGIGQTSDDIGNWENISHWKISNGKSWVKTTPDELLLMIPLLFVAGMIGQLTFPNVRQTSRENAWADWLWLAISVIAFYVALLMPRISG